MPKEIFPQDFQNEDPVVEKSRVAEYKGAIDFASEKHHGDLASSKNYCGVIGSSDVCSTAFGVLPGKKKPKSFRGESAPVRVVGIEVVHPGDMARSKEDTERTRKAREPVAAKTIKESPYKDFLGKVKGWFSK